MDAGEAAIPAFADDYAFLIWGLLELYETTFDVGHLQAALDLTRDLLGHFWDAEAGALFSTADDAEGLLIRQVTVHAGVTRSPRPHLRTPSPQAERGLGGEDRDAPPPHPLFPPLRLRRGGGSEGEPHTT